MATKNPRINIIFAEKTAELLTTLAHQEYKSVSGFVRELVLEALEMREDLYFSRLVEKLDKPGTKTYTHEEVWR